MTHGFLGLCRVFLEESEHNDQTLIALYYGKIIDLASWKHFYCSYHNRKAVAILTTSQNFQQEHRTHARVRIRVCCCYATSKPCSVTGCFFFRCVAVLSPSQRFRTIQHCTGNVWSHTSRREEHGWSFWAGISWQRWTSPSQVYFSGSLLLGNLNFTQGLIFPVFTNADF